LYVDVVFLKDDHTSAITQSKKELFGFNLILDVHKVKCKKHQKVGQEMASSSFNLEDLSPKSHIMMEYMKKLEEKLGILEDGLESIKNHWNMIKGKIRPFSGNGNVNKYYDWEIKVMQNLDCLDYDDYMKRLEESIHWVIEELKKEMLDCFVPLYCKCDLFAKLQKEMEVTLIRAQLVNLKKPQWVHFKVDIIKTFMTLWSYMIILLFLCLYSKLLKLNPNLRGMKKKSYTTNSSN
ncbi:hypothetical protein CR513_16014, partial [Mucuna pruriens]